MYIAKMTLSNHSTKKSAILVEYLQKMGISGIWYIQIPVMLNCNILL